MDYATKSTHDEINLARLVRRLEKSAADPSWTQDDEDDSAKWLRAVSMRQKIKYARTLLKNVELYDFEPTPTSAKRYHDFRTTLDTTDTFAKNLEERVAPQPIMPEPILPTIPIPEDLKPAQEHEQDTRPELLPEPSADSLLLPPSDPTPSPLAMPSLLPPSAQTTAKASGISPQFLHNSNALQDELSGQLEQMAAQLLRNARHFNDTLARDQAVVEDTQVKIESNFDVAKKERIRLRDHRGKSGMTTCWIIYAIIAVTILFGMMVMLIRMTKLA